MVCNKSTVRVRVRGVGSSRTLTNTGVCAEQNPTSKGLRHTLLRSAKPCTSCTWRIGTARLNRRPSPSSIPSRREGDERKQRNLLSYHTFPSLIILLPRPPLRPLPPPSSPLLPRGPPLHSFPLPPPSSLLPPLLSQSSGGGACNVRALQERVPHSTCAQGGAERRTSSSLQASSWNARRPRRPGAEVSYALSALSLAATGGGMLGSSMSSSGSGAPEC